MIACDYPGCTAQYRRKEHLTRHARKHYPTAPRLTCEVCSKTFDRTDSLRRHWQLHLREGDNTPRTSKACDQCHASKTRCSGGEPCSVCSRRGALCTFNRLSKRTVARDSPGVEGQAEPQSFNAVYQSSTDSSVRNPDPLHHSYPTAMQTSFSGSEIQDLLLQHENHLREKGLLASCRAEPANESQQRGSSPELDIDRYVDVYFSHFHYEWPVVHKRSFRLSKEPQILLLAVVMIGLWITGDCAAQFRAEAMHDKLLTLLENRMDDWKFNTEFNDKSWPMTTYQTVILNVIFAVMRDVHQDLYQRCRSLLHAVTTTCITGGLFSYEKMRALIEPPDSLLFSWTYLEEIKRLALVIFKLNVHFRTGLLVVTDLHFHLPASGYLWDSPESTEFYRRYNAQLESGTCVDNKPLICDLFRDVQDGRRGPGLLFQTDPWLGQRPHQAMERVLLHLTQEINLGGHGCHHHQNNPWSLEIDTWGQLELLKQLLCQRRPNLPLDEYILSDIDFVISHKISVWKGDITTLTDVTAIVNAANSALLGCFQSSHRCIDNVVHSAAGPRLRQACYNLMQEQGCEEPSGRAKVTNLPVSYVIHTVGPELDYGQMPTLGHRKTLSECYVSCLEAAELLPALRDGRKVIAFCCISTGLFAFPFDIAAQIALETVYRWCSRHPERTVTDVVFDTFLQRDWELYNEKSSSLSVSDDTIHSPSAPPMPTVSPAIATARSWLQEANYLMISAGAGLSAATGLDYTSPDLFAKHFPAFLPLGLRRLYEVFGFTRWKSPAQKWGYYFHHLNMVRTWPASPLYASLLQIASRFNSGCFIRTSNADGLFVGQYAYLQCLAKCRREAVFPSAPFLDAALPFLDLVTQVLTDDPKIPSCKYCGGELTLCVRGGDYFNPSPFQAQEREYKRFLSHLPSTLRGTAREETQKTKAVILELGVGMNTPSVLRWPNEELVEGGQGAFRLIRAGMNAAGCVPWELEEEGLAVGINGDLNAVIGMLASSY
ncbi:hypothetical protein BDW62DRAFT_220585 [Aspergillus aurantiobrunneus]